MSSISSRVTPTVLDNQVISGLQADQLSISNLAQELSTGNKINQPSDNPVGAVQVLSIQATLARSTQYQTNASNGMSMLQLANSTLNSALGQLQDIRSLVVSVANPVTTAHGLAPIADQISQMESSLLSLANTTYAGRPIFGGTSGATAAYQVVQPTVGPPATSGTSQYLGSGAPTSMAVAPGISVPAGVANPFSGTTTQNTGTAGPGGSVDVFGALNQLVADLRAGNVAAVTGADATNLDTAMTQVTSAAGKAGALYTQMNALNQQAATTGQQLQLEFAHVQGADLAQVSSDFAQAQTTYQGALYAAAQVTKLPSLVSFLG